MHDLFTSFKKLYCACFFIFFNEVLCLFDHSCYYSINALYFTFFFFLFSFFWINFILYLLLLRHFTYTSLHRFFLFLIFLFSFFGVCIELLFFFFNKVMLTSANNFKISKNNILYSIFWVTINLIFVFL